MERLKISRVFCFLALFATTHVADGDQCYSFAGGSVYPQETSKSSGHTLQWTKAMSKCKLTYRNDSTTCDYFNLKKIRHSFQACTRI